MTTDLRIGTGPIVGVLELSNAENHISGQLITLSGDILVEETSFESDDEFQQEAAFDHDTAHRIAMHLAHTDTALGTLRDRLTQQPGSFLVVGGTNLSVILNEVPTLGSFLERMAPSGSPARIFEVNDEAIVVATEGLGFRMILALSSENRLYAINLGCLTESSVEHNRKSRQQTGLAETSNLLGDKVIVLPMALEWAWATTLSFTDLRALAPEAAEAAIVDHFWSVLAPAEDDEILRFGDPRYVFQNDARTTANSGQDFDTAYDNHEARLMKEVTCANGTISEAIEIMKLALTIAGIHKRDRDEIHADELEAMPEHDRMMHHDQIYGTLTVAFDDDPATFRYEGPGEESVQSIFVLVRDRFQPEGSCLTDAHGNRESTLFWDAVYFEPEIEWFRSKSAHERIALEDEMRTVLTKTLSTTGEVADAIIAGLAAPGPNEE